MVLILLNWTYAVTEVLHHQGTKTPRNNKISTTNREARISTNFSFVSSREANSRFAIRGKRNWAIYFR